MNEAAPGFLGVLMLDTRFPRPPGDVGNPETYARAGIPVRFLTAVRLAAEGASMITTSCGFLAAYQALLSAAVPVPVVTSSLLQVRHCAHPGIVTFDAHSLTPCILQAAGVPEGTPVAGLQPGCELHRRILDNDTVLDLAEARRNVVDAAMRLVEAFPAIENIVLECTNMPPYRDAVTAAVGRQVHDIETLILDAWRTGNTAQHLRR
jgi:hypothetical protein